MKEIKGNLITLAEKGEFDVIVHGCNCMHVFGAGIAKEIKERYPQAYEEDLKTTAIIPYDHKLGSCSMAVERGEGDHTFYIVNAYTQVGYGTDKRYVDYNAVYDVFKYLGENFSDSRIGYPLIGAGLGGGKWMMISQVINDALEGCDHTLVRWDGS